MKCQDLFSLKKKKKNLDCGLLQILLGALNYGICMLMSYGFPIFRVNMVLLVKVSLHN